MSNMLTFQYALYLPIKADNWLPKIYSEKLKYAK